MMNVLLQPCFCLFRMMDRMSIHNEKHFTFVLAYQTSEKRNKYVRLKSLFKHHEIKASPVGDSRYHITTETLSGSGDNRRLTTTAVGASHCMVGAETHLITPVNLSLFTLSLFPNHGIFFLQPALHLLRILLKCPAHWLLWCKTPTCKISTYRPDRNPYTESSLNQLCHCRIT